MTAPRLPRVDDTLRALAPEIGRTPPGESALWQVSGPATAGKSALLSALRETLSGRGLCPVLLRPPLASFDSASAVLADLAGGLHAHGLVNGQIARWQEPAPFAEKLRTALGWLEDTADRVVLLIDEPGRWPSRSPEDDRFSAHAREVARALTGRVRCRRVVAGPPSEADLSPVRVIHLQRASEPGPWLCDRATWGPLADAAEELWCRAGDRLAPLSPLDLRLLVAITFVSSVETALQALGDPAGRRAFARELARRLDADAHFRPATKTWARLALLRRPFDEALLAVLGATGLSADVQAIVRACLLYEEEGKLVLHETLRLDAREHGWLGGAEERDTHSTIAHHYADAFQARGSLADELEAFFHATRAADARLLAELRPLLSDQLDAMGRELSRVNRDYTGAVRVFERSLEWDPENDYAHHYLAFNLDVQGTEPARVEEHYQRAIALAPENTWWRSRWVSYLVTRGRTAMARQAWDDALDALALPDPDASPEIYENLHLWVARLLIHRGQLDFADHVLRGIPSEIKHRHPGLRSLARLLSRLIEARAARAVFPLSVEVARWWDGPHLAARRDREGRALARWLPGRIDAIDEGVVSLLVAEPPGSGGASPRYGHIDISRAEFDRASRDERSEDLSAGRFVELAFYGDAEEPVIRVHRPGPFRDEDLPPLFPDPARYLRTAGWVGA